MSEEQKKWRLSYSATTQFMQCEKKYFVERVMKVPRDADCEEDATALRWGKCFHETLEACNHRRELYKPEMLQDAAKRNELDQHAIWAVYASIRNYFTLHEKSKLEVVVCEIEVGSEAEEVIGYIDAVMADANGYWWIVDLKTSGMIMTMMFPRLRNDPQLNLYASFAKDVAARLGLDVTKFAGVRYRVVGKTKIMVKANDTMETYAARANPKAMDIEIPVENLQLELVRKNHEEMLKRIRKVRDGEVTPIPNFSKCLEWNRSCEYWSQCYGKTYTDCSNSTVVFDHEDMTDRTCLGDVLL